MAEIKLQKRVVYAGDVHIALLKDGWSIADATKFVRELPTAEVEPVRRGQLGISYLDEYFGEFADCKERGTDNILPCNYCRQCGRKIDGGAENA